jgi:T-complex protein 1 subunit theta
MVLFREITKLAEETESLDQYAIRKFAESFLVIPRALAESSGLNSTDVISNLNAFHDKGEKTYGVDVESEECKDSIKDDLYDCYLTKYWAIKLSVQSVVNILSVDQIIMGRPSG